MDSFKAVRMPYWEEMSVEQRVCKLAEAIEILGRSVVELERENALLRQHSHGSDGHLLIPLACNQVEQPWYKTHLLDRQPPC